MMTTSPAHSTSPAAAASAGLADPDLPVVAELLSAPVPGPLAAAIGIADGVVTHAAIRQVTWWPGSSITVQWAATIRGGPLEGEHQLVATTRSAPEGALVVGDGDDSLAIWRVPHDPFLPGMAPALDAGVAADVVASLGGELVDPHTRLRAYRPSRRAVVEVTGEGHRLYFKVVRPRRSRSLHRLHDELAAHLPVPQPLGIDRERGIVAMSSLPGRTLRRVLEDPTATLPDPAVVAGLAQAVPDLGELAAVTSSIEQLPRVAGLLTRLVPGEADRVARLADAIGSDDVSERVPAHGDLHEAQLLVDADGQVVGLLDVDTVGRARPGDDPSTMLGHLAVWATMTRQPARVRALAADLQRRWDAQVDPVDLRLRAAARILGLALGPFRVQRDDWPAETSRRLDLAQRWVESAARVRETGLTASTG